MSNMRPLEVTKYAVDLIVASVVIVSSVVRVTRSVVDAVVVLPKPMSLLADVSTYPRDVPAGVSTRSVTVSPSAKPKSVVGATNDPVVANVPSAVTAIEPLTGATQPGSLANEAVDH